MNHFFALVSLVLLLSGCSTLNNIGNYFTNGATVSSPVVEFWRPINEPNVLLPPEKAQEKVAFDLSQCNCGMFPSNASQPDLISFQPAEQRYIETSIVLTRNGQGGDCMRRPNLVVAECMRMRGWEVTNCSGRMPLANGGSMCAGAILEED